MRKWPNVTGRARLISVFVFVLIVAPAVPVIAGRGLFFRRVARSYGSTGAVAGSWGSHGASGGGRVRYRNGYPVHARGVVVQQRAVGNYASHGAVGGSPQGGMSATAQRAVQPRYPGNRVVVSRPASRSAAAGISTATVPRVSIPSHPVECVVENVGSAPQIRKSTTLPTPEKVIVPPAPNTRVRNRAAYHTPNAGDVVFDDILPLQSIARLETQRHNVLKPMTDEPDLVTEVTDVEEQDAASARLDAEQQPKLDVDELVLLADPVEKTATPKTVVTSSDVLTIESQDRDAVHTVTQENPTEPELDSVLVQRSNAGLEDERPAETVLTPEPEPEPEPEPVQSQRARLVLNVPADAEVFLMGRRMVTIGETRLFNVPIGDSTKQHSYHIRVKALQGHGIETTQLIRAGQRLELTIADVAGRFAVSPPHVSVFE